MKKIYPLLCLLYALCISPIIANGANSIKLTINFITTNSIEGYDLQSKLVVFCDDKQIGESRPKLQSQANAVTVNVPQGNHTIKAVLYALYKNNYEPRLKRNEYSFDFEFTKTSNWIADKTINLDFDILREEVFVDQKTKPLVKEENKVENDNQTNLSLHIDETKNASNTTIGQKESGTTVVPIQNGLQLVTDSIKLFDIRKFDMKLFIAEISKIIENQNNQFSDIIGERSTDNKFTTKQILTNFYKCFILDYKNSSQIMRYEAESFNMNKASAATLINKMDVEINKLLATSKVNRIVDVDVKTRKVINYAYNILNEYGTTTEHKVIQLDMYTESENGADPNAIYTITIRADKRGR